MNIDFHTVGPEICRRHSHNVYTILYNSVVVQSTIAGFQTLFKKALNFSTRSMKYTAHEFWTWSCNAQANYIEL